jgi:DNA-directed RNA polymerase II subunit RPB3
MEPQVINLGKDEQYLRFTLENVNVSIANSLRRIILSEIPCVVFRTSPYEKNLATIEINTSRMNNELIKQRLSCIPIHIQDTTFPYSDFVVEVDVHNRSKEIVYVTTGDFKIRHVESNKYLDDQTTREIFPKDKITDEFIDLIRLRPEISDTIKGEHIKMSMKFDIGTAKEDGAFNVVSTCTYAATPNQEEIEKTWSLMESKMKNENKSENDIEYAKKDWLLLDAKRIVKPNSFDFTIESVGQFEEIMILNKAIDVMKEKLTKLKVIIYEQGVVSKSTTTIPNSFDIILKGEDYTLGKVLEFILYRDYYESSNTETLALNYCGFQKPHPHIDLSVIRLGFSEENITDDEVRNLLVVVCQTAIDIYTNIEEKITIE